MFVALGAGEARYEPGLRELAAAWPGRVAFHQGYSEELAHWIEATSDIFLMPSQYEPCGLNQMYSLRYGTVPVVRRTGGLADSVQRYDPATGSGTGVVFDPFTVPALVSAVDTALDLYADARHWQRLVPQWHGAGFLLGAAGSPLPLRAVRAHAGDDARGGVDAFAGAT